jgi:hypothetical protein
LFNATYLNRFRALYIMYLRQKPASRHTDVSKMVTYTCQYIWENISHYTSYLAGLEKLKRFDDKVAYAPFSIVSFNRLTFCDC